MLHAAAGTRYPSYHGHGAKPVSHGRGRQGNLLSGLEYKLPQVVHIRVKSLVYLGEKTTKPLANKVSFLS
jgi:hypothetical protein